MSPDRFQVLNARAVTEQYRDMLRAARDQGILPLTARATAWIMEELARTPMEFGESREYLPHLDLYMRAGFAGPVYVEFAVNLPNRMVFLRRITLRR